MEPTCQFLAAHGEYPPVYLSYIEIRYVQLEANQASAYFFDGISVRYLGPHYLVNKAASPTSSIELLERLHYQEAM